MGVMNRKTTKGNRRRSAGTRGPAVKGKGKSKDKGAVQLVPPAWLTLAVTLCSLVFGGYYTWDLISQSGRLRVQGIEIDGNERIVSEELGAYLGIEAGDDIFTADLDAAALGLKRHPWVKAANVRRRLPDKVMAQVWEHEPGLLVALSELYIANQEGILFKKLIGSDGIVLPVLTGLKRSDIENNPAESTSVVREAIALAEAVKQRTLEQGLGQVDELHWDQYLGWSFVFREEDEVITAHLGFQPLERLDFAIAALERLGPLSQRPVEIWADGLVHQNRVQIRLLDKSLTENSGTLIAKAGDTDG